MFKELLIILGIFIMINLISCSGSVSDIDNESNLIYQVPGCQNSALMDNTASDSGFSYSFGQNLIVDFYVSANCCPDSNRFELFDRICNDTIYVTVIDTADHLCDCICNYQIHFEKCNLPLNSYLFYCKYNDEVLYAIRVFRKNFFY